MKVSGKILLFILILSGFSAPWCGATVYHSNGSAAHVRALHNVALNGDTITMPAGTFKWSTPVRISKGITILGAGIGHTIIISAVTVGARRAPFYIRSRGAVRISGLTCVGGSGDQAGFISVASAGFRIDHCAFTHLTKRGVGAYSTVNSWGVIDHCTFRKLSGSPQGVSVFGDGDAAWSRPLSLGTINAVYIEDCTFTWPSQGDSCIDIYNGGRVVFRHNTVTNVNLGCHGLDSGGYRSPVSWEIYENTFLVTIPLANQFYFRGGTGVVYNNKVTTSGAGRLSGNSINVTCYRATGTCIVPQYTPWGRVTGSNPYDGNTNGYGWPALDQIGAAPPTTPSNILAGPPAAGRSVQGRSPAYAWGNIISINGAPAVAMRMGVTTYSGSCYPSGIPGEPNVGNLIQENRDFFNGTQKPGYSPYVYPHPLTLQPTDFNNDGHPDYVLQNAATRQTAIWYMNNAVFVSGAYGPTLPSGWNLAGVADFNGDGRLDYLLFNASTGQSAIWYLSGVTLLATTYGPTLPGGSTLVGVGNFNGDGKPDYVLYMASTGQTAVWYMNNAVFVSGAYGPTLPPGWSFFGP
jgi:hypothetical protein